jgi:hypothetical protein
MIALLGLSVAMLVAAAVPVPERVYLDWRAERRLGRIRIGLAAAGLGIFIGLVLPVLAEQLG